jgi:hypothetical protein
MTPTDEVTAATCRYGMAPSGPCFDAGVSHGTDGTLVGVVIVVMAVLLTVLITRAVVDR